MSEYSTQRDALVAALGRVLDAGVPRYGEIIWRDDPDDLRAKVYEELDTPGTYRVHTWMARPNGSVEVSRTQGKRRRTCEWLLYGYMSVDTRDDTTWTADFYEEVEALEDTLEEHVRAASGGKVAFAEPPVQLSLGESPLFEFVDLPCLMAVIRVRFSAFRRRTAQD